jgi:hypothetical protein
MIVLHGCTRKFEFINVIISSSLHNNYSEFHLLLRSNFWAPVTVSHLHITPYQNLLEKHSVSKTANWNEAQWHAADRTNKLHGVEYFLRS